MMKSNYILNIYLTFVFTKKESLKQEFLALELFERNKNIKKGNYKEKVFNDSELYSIIVFSDISTYESVYNSVCEEIALNKQNLQILGLKEGVKIEFFIEYKETIVWGLSHSQLIELDKVTSGYPEISFNSIDQSWDDKLEPYYQETYCQIIFASGKMQVSLNHILKILKKEFSNKYSNRYCINKKESNLDELIFSLKDDVNYYNWDEVFTDVLDFIAKYSLSFKEKNISLTFGISQYNRSDMNGGGIESEIINRLIDLGLGIRINMSSSFQNVGLNKKNTENNA